MTLSTLNLSSAAISQSSARARANSLSSNQISPPIKLRHSSHNFDAIMLTRAEIWATCDVMAAAVRFGSILCRRSRVLGLQGARAFGERPQDVYWSCKRNGVPSVSPCSYATHCQLLLHRYLLHKMICSACIVKSCRPVSMVPRGLQDQLMWLKSKPWLTVPLSFSLTEIVAVCAARAQVRAGTPH